jgi:hypothetical protein
MLVFNASAHQDTTRESDDLNSMSKCVLSVPYSVAENRSGSRPAMSPKVATGPHSLDGNGDRTLFESTCD